MSRTFALVALALLASGCERRPSPAEEARADARDIAIVEAAQKVAPPLAELAPEPIAPADIETHKLSGPRCAFVLEDSDGAVALATPRAAFLKIDGSLRAYAADKGSAQLPFGAWTRYEGREHIVDLQIAGDGSGGKDSAWSGRLTVRDPYSRIVFSAAGMVRCGV
jgi:hypothetical protein